MGKMAFYNIMGTLLHFQRGGHKVDRNAPLEAGPWEQGLGVRNQWWRALGDSPGREMSRRGALGQGPASVLHERGGRYAGA